MEIDHKRTNSPARRAPSFQDPFPSTKDLKTYGKWSILYLEKVLLQIGLLRLIQMATKLLVDLFLQVERVHRPDIGSCLHYYLPALFHLLLILESLLLDEAITKNPGKVRKGPDWHRLEFFPTEIQAGPYHKGHLPAEVDGGSISQNIHSNLRKYHPQTAVNSRFYVISIRTEAGHQPAGRMERLVEVGPILAHQILVDFEPKPTGQFLANNAEKTRLKRNFWLPKRFRTWVNWVNP